MADLVKVSKVELSREILLSVAYLHRNTQFNQKGSGKDYADFLP